MIKKEKYAGWTGRVLNLAYIATIAVVLITPAIGVNLDPNLSVDHRAAAKFPELSACKIPDFPRQFEAWFNDRFKGRTSYISIGNILILRLFRESPNEQVIRGQDGFFFLASHQRGKRNSLIWQFFKFERRQVDANAEAFVSQIPFLKRTPKKVLFLNVPTKHLLYFDRFPAFIKGEVPEPRRFFPTEVTKEIIRRRPDAAKFFTDLRSEAERAAAAIQLIPPANFHWMPGPYTRLAANVVARRLGLVKQVYVPKREDYRSYRIKSDLNHLIYHGLETDALLSSNEDFAKVGITTAPDAAKIIMPGTAVRSPMMASHSHYTFNSAVPSGRMLLIGDSFTNALHMDMARYIREVVSVEYSVLYSYDAVSARKDLRQLIACWRPEYIVVVSHFDVSLWGRFVTAWLPPGEIVPRTVRFNENICFRDLDLYSFKTDGFCPPEPQGCWAGRKAVLELQLPQSVKRQIRLTFTGRPVNAKQTVKIYDHRKQLLKAEPLAKTGQYVVDLTRSSITADNKLKLFFDFPEASSSKDGDGKTLSFFFQTLKLSLLNQRMVLPQERDIDFNDLDCYISKTDGFCPPELQGSWACRKAMLELQLPQPVKRQIRLTFTGRPVNAKQTVKIYDNRMRLLKAGPLAKPGQYVVDLPRSSITEDNKLKLFFDFPEASSPDSDDVRPLSFFFQTLKLTPLNMLLALPLGRDIDFSDLDCYRSKTDGFCPPEPHGGWAGRKAMLELQLPQPVKRQIRLTFTGRPVNAKQTVKIYDHRMHLLKVGPLAKPGQYVVDLTRSSITADNKLKLFFDFPEACTPVGGDVRILSFFFQTLKFTPLNKRLALPQERDIDFNDLDCFISKKNGFCLPEPQGCWAGRKAVLELQLPQSVKRQFRLIFTGCPVNAKQTVKIYDHRMHLLKAGPLAKPGQYVVHLPRGSITSDNKLKLFFDFPEACRPEGDDVRILSFFFQLIRLSTP